MKATYGHWAIVALILFIGLSLAYGQILDYHLLSLESQSSLAKVDLGCAQTISGKVSLKLPKDNAKLLLTLEYSLNNDEQAERSTLVTGSQYSLTVRGRPLSDSLWTLRAYYFDAQGQLAETAQQFANLSCDQKITADLEL